MTSKSVLSVVKTASFPVPATVPLNGMTPIVNSALVAVAALPAVVPTIGPRMRTVLLSMGSALAAMIGLTVTVLALKLTVLDAARLKPNASCDAPLEERLNAALGSSFTVSWMRPTARPSVPTGVRATPSRLPSS